MEISKVISISLDRLRAFERVRSRQPLIYDSHQSRVKTENERSFGDGQLFTITTTHLKLPVPPELNFLAEVRADEIPRIKISTLEASAGRKCQVEITVRRNGGQEKKRAGSSLFKQPSSSRQAKRPRHNLAAKSSPVTIDLTRPKVVFVDETSQERLDRLSHRARFPTSEVIVISSDEESGDKNHGPVTKEWIVHLLFTPELGSAKTMKDVCFTENPVQSFFELLALVGPSGSREVVPQTITPPPSTPPLSSTGFLDYEQGSSDQRDAETLSGLLPDPSNRLFLDSIFEGSLTQDLLVSHTQPDLRDDLVVPQLSEKEIPVVESQSSIQPTKVKKSRLGTYHDHKSNDDIIVPQSTDFFQHAKDTVDRSTTQETERSRSPSASPSGIPDGPEQAPGAPRPILNLSQLNIKSPGPTQTSQNSSTERPSLQPKQKIAEIRRPVGLTLHEIEDLDDGSYYPEDGSEREQSADMDINDNVLAELDGEETGESTSSSSDEKKAESPESEAFFTENEIESHSPRKSRTKSQKFESKRERANSASTIDLETFSLENLSHHERKMFVRRMEDKIMVLNRTNQQLKQEKEKLKINLKNSEKQAKSTNRKFKQEQERLINLTEQLEHDLRSEWDQIQLKLMTKSESLVVNLECKEKMISELQHEKLLLLNRESLYKTTSKDQASKIKRLQKEIQDIQTKINSADKILFEKNRENFELQEKVRLLEGEPCE
ncbi:hypothetical protein CROQUDRAFT_668723 [Cronartium quercuum f. sp. fusiforme G11]|uniref:Uncharacterized protein n=1 Tax=Cronartium quercuum f. sp. fusiforme G11 TaxID=708437 RepID=A0A9P6TFB4_9BASI|nr:hypothetical protein CROQUDRAFT_668723 [Cronartium quercuum f. sp. fusiforme G11]